VFNVSTSGIITNISALNEITVYYVNISVNDTTNNLISAVFFINVTLAKVSKCNGNYTLIKIPVANNRPYIKLCHMLEFR